MGPEAVQGPAGEGLEHEGVGGARSPPLQGGLGGGEPGGRAVGGIPGPPVRQAHRIEGVRLHRPVENRVPQVTHDAGVVEVQRRHARATGPGDCGDGGGDPRRGLYAPAVLEQVSKHGAESTSEAGMDYNRRAQQEVPTMTDSDAARPMWDRRRVLTLLIAGVVGQTLLITLDGPSWWTWMGAALLGLTLAHALFFFRNVRLATRLEAVLRESGDLPDDYDESDDSAPMGSAQPWSLLLLPAVYVAGHFDAHLEVLVTVAIWIDLVRLVVQFLMVAVIHADLRHRVRMLTDPAYLQRALEIARAKESGEDRR